MTYEELIKKHPWVLESLKDFKKGEGFRIISDEPHHVHIKVRELHLFNDRTFGRAVMLDVAYQEDRRIFEDSIKESAVSKYPFLKNYFKV